MIVQFRPYNWNVSTQPAAPNAIHIPRSKALKKLIIYPGSPKGVISMVFWKRQLFWLWLKINNSKKHISLMVFDLQGIHFGPKLPAEKHPSIIKELKVNHLWLKPYFYREPPLLGNCEYKFPSQKNHKKTSELPVFSIIRSFRQKKQFFPYSLPNTLWVSVFGSPNTSE